jgi:hypothetical protein
METILWQVIEKGGGGGEYVLGGGMLTAEAPNKTEI